MRGKSADTSVDTIDETIAAAMAHELKSPLVLIRQLALSISEDCGNSSESAESIDRLIATAEKALRTTTELSAMYRQQGRLFNLEPINPHAVCEDAIEVLRPMLRLKGARINVKRRTTIPLVQGQRSAMRSILVGFIENALQYTANNRHITIRISYSKKADRVRILVRDYGPGIDASVIDSVTAKMARPCAISRRPNSSGIGLYLARQFAECMDSTIGAIAHRDGASFYIDFKPTQQLQLL